MTKAKMLVSLTAAALSLGFSVQPHPAPFWKTKLVLAAENTYPNENAQTNEDNSAAKSEEMGKDEGGQTGGANKGTPPEADTQKIEQPPRQDPTTGNQQ